MKFLREIGWLVLASLVISAGIAGALVVVKPWTAQAPTNLENKLLGNVSNQPVFFTMTNATTSVSRIAVTTVFSAGSFNNYARITNTSGNNISCYLETATAASSTLAAGAGITIGRVSSTFSGEPSVCFGYAPGCIPYVGKVNCKATVTTTGGLIYN